MSSDTKVAFIGNPNCGKSTLFNRLSGLSQKTSNLPGTTVEAFHGEAKFNNTNYHLVDLPGIYSLFTESEDEKLVVTHVAGIGEKQPDVFLFVLDASNLRRNLLLFSQVSEFQKPAVCVLTMQDTAKRRGIQVNIEALENELGIPCIWFNPREDKDPSPVFKAIERARNTHSLGQPTQIEERLKQFWSGNKPTGLNQETLSRYIEIEKLLARTTSKNTQDWKGLTLKFDKWATHPIWGYFILGFIMLVLFQGVFSIAAKPMEWIETLFQWINEGIASNLPDNHFTDFLTNGLMSGLEGVVVFVPQIFILFFLIGLLEDSGYMVRASFITDRIMRKLGLNGRSIIPMVGGFACAIPSIMATRSIRSKSERLATMLVVPLMSCSARLPVYVLLVSIAIPFTTFWGPFHAQTFVITAAYMSGIFIAILLAFVLNLVKKEKNKHSEFILELPTYQKPRWQTVTHQAWLKCTSFLEEAGKIIVIISMVLWWLSSFGPSTAIQSAELKAQQIIAENAANEQYANEIKANCKLEASYAGHLGKFIEPAIEPLGYDWKTGIALISSFAAREVFVGTMATLFQSSEDNTQGIRDKMQTEVNPETGKLKYGLPYALSLIVFYAFALQCMSTMAVMKRETGSWKWPISMFVIYGVIAYIGAYIVFNLAS